MILSWRGAAFGVLACAWTGLGAIAKAQAVFDSHGFETPFYTSGSITGQDSWMDGSTNGGTVTITPGAGTGDKVDMDKATKTKMYADYKGSTYFFCCGGCAALLERARAFGVPPYARSS